MSKLSFKNLYLYKIKPFQTSHKSMVLVNLSQVKHPLVTGQVPMIFKPGICIFHQSTTVQIQLK